MNDVGCWQPSYYWPSGESSQHILFYIKLLCSCTAIRNNGFRAQSQGQHFLCDCLCIQNVFGLYWMVQYRVHSSGETVRGVGLTHWKQPNTVKTQYMCYSSTRWAIVASPVHTVVCTFILGQLVCAVISPLVKPLGQRTQKSQQAKNLYMMKWVNVLKTMKTLHCHLSFCLSWCFCSPFFLFAEFPFYPASTF